MYVIRARTTRSWVSNMLLAQLWSKLWIICTCVCNEDDKENMSQLNSNKRRRSESTSARQVKKKKRTIAQSKYFKYCTYSMYFIDNVLFLHTPCTKAKSSGAIIDLSDHCNTPTMEFNHGE